MLRLPDANPSKPWCWITRNFIPWKILSLCCQEDVAVLSRCLSQISLNWALVLLYFWAALLDHKNKVQVQPKISSFVWKVLIFWHCLPFKIIYSDPLLYQTNSLVMHTCRRSVNLSPPYQMDSCLLSKLVKVGCRRKYFSSIQLIFHFKQVW